VYALVLTQLYFIWW